jgi:hypothetical protein
LIDLAVVRILEAARSEADFREGGIDVMRRDQVRRREFCSVGTSVAPWTNTY